jgi:hypothetical protein
VTTDEIGVVRTWDTATARCLAALAGVGLPAVDARKGRIAVPSAPGAARILDPRSGDPDGEVRCHTRRALRRERTADGIAALAERLPRWAETLYDRAGRWSAGVGSLVCCAGPGLSWTLVVGSTEEITGNLVLAWQSLAFLGPDGRAVEERRIPGRCVTIGAP